MVSTDHIQELQEKDKTAANCFSNWKCDQGLKLTSLGL